MVRILEANVPGGEIYRVEDENGNTLGWEVTEPFGANSLSPYEPLDGKKASVPIPVIAHGDFTRKQTVIFAGLATFVSSIAAQLIGHFLL